MTRSCGVIIVAAGSGRRFGNEDKVLASLGGRPMIEWSLDLFSGTPGVEQIVVVAGAHSIERIQGLAAGVDGCRVNVCLGGEMRRDSVRAGFAHLDSNLDLVAVHDAARPLTDAGLVARVFQTAALHGAAVPGLPATDTMYQVGADGLAESVLPRSALWAVQTPQIARYDWLSACLQQEGDFTDEGSALIASGYPVHVVKGSPENIKVTHPDDLERADIIRSRRDL